MTCGSERVFQAVGTLWNVRHTLSLHIDKRHAASDTSEPRHTNSLRKMLLKVSSTVAGAPITSAYALRQRRTSSRQCVDAVVASLPRSHLRGESHVHTPETGTDARRLV